METIKTIIRERQYIECKLTLENEGIYAQYLLETNCRGFKNSYLIDAKICGLYELREKSLYIAVTSVECLNFEDTNEETLIDEAIEDIFTELIN